jgi:hypothetical protein
MNFKMKTLVAAALATVAMSSSSAFAITNTGGGELFLLAYDTVGLNTFVATLDSIAPSVAGFTGDSSLSKSFVGDANWTSFSSATTFNSSNVIYSVLGLDVTSKKLLTTSSAFPAGSVGTNNAFTTLAADAVAAGGTLGLWMTNYNAGVTGNVSAFLTGTGNGTGAVLSTKWGTKLPLVGNTSAALGVDNLFYAISPNATSTAKTALLAKSQFVNSAGASVWNLSSTGTLSYTVAAVPEANTWAMMLAGLGLMGFVARRRS